MPQEIPDTREFRQQVQALIQEFKPGGGDLLPALHTIQHEFGYIPRAAAEVIAQHLKLGASDVWGALTFYSELRTVPPADVIVGWCSGPACRLKGGESLRRIFEAELGFPMRTQSIDRKLGLHLAQCNGQCRLAPLVWINGKERGNLTMADGVRLARALKTGELGS
ncbi:MAG TPA: NAD(P)H-dependent oxidoreductase subunit E [Dehalococcoidia bacterium]|nr:NAD(P)H-dependent oxidoreductase subunit E [Dehalococcoidia bacterium]